MLDAAHTSYFNLGLTGYPLGHSLSPQLHAAALKSTGLEGEYRIYPISPDDPSALAVLLGRLRRGELHGLNVTIPHKQAVIPLLDELSATARAIGAVNTIHARAGRLVGDNTDAPGFLADLKKFLGGQPVAADRAALVLGAGGSARAVVYALAMAGWQVTIAARHPEQARSIVAGLPSPDPSSRVSSVDYQPSSISILLPRISLVVNTTPVGMSPQAESSPWPDGLPFPRAHLYDLVYNPRQTLLVRQARAAGLPAQTGLGMLVEQAALAFAIWTGRDPSRAAMFASVGATRA